MDCSSLVYGIEGKLVAWLAQLRNAVARRRISNGIEWFIYLVCPFAVWIVSFVVWLGTFERCLECIQLYTEHGKHTHSHRKVPSHCVCDIFPLWCNPKWQAIWDYPLNISNKTLQSKLKNFISQKTWTFQMLTKAREKRSQTPERCNNPAEKQPPQWNWAQRKIWFFRSFLFRFVVRTGFCTAKSGMHAQTARGLPKMWS